MATLNNTTLPTPLIPAQVSVLDFFVPGSTSILAAIELALGTNSYFRPLMLCMLLAFLSRRVFRYIWDVAETYFVSTVHVQHSSEVYDMVSLWITSQPFARRARSSVARVGWRGSSYREDDHEDETQKKPLHYYPWKGTFYFTYNKHLFWFCSMEKEVNHGVEEVVTVSCFGPPTVLRQFFNDCRDAYLKLTSNKTTIFEHHIGRWKRTKLKSIRPISTVVINEEDKERLLRDIESFLDPGALRWHTNRGIPYRKGYLLYGPPGTGKSSLCLSLAGHFGLDVYILNISTANGPFLGALLAELPSRCVLLLEDVDAAGVARPRQGETDISQAKDDVTQGTPRSQGKASWSDLLNALDGVSAQEGRLLMMTTNHMDHLDEALIQAGRVDRKMELPNADKDVAFRLFCMIFKKAKDDIPDPKQQAEDDKTVESYARKFAREIPDREFSPAEIQSYLVEHRSLARMAVEKVQEWMDRTRAERAKMAKVDSFTAVSPSTE